MKIFTNTLFLLFILYAGCSSIKTSKQNDPVESDVKTSEESFKRIENTKSDSPDPCIQLNDKISVLINKNFLKGQLHLDNSYSNSPNIPIPSPAEEAAGIETFNTSTDIVVGYLVRFHDYDISGPEYHNKKHLRFVTVAYDLINQREKLVDIADVYTSGRIISEAIAIVEDSKSRTSPAAYISMQLNYFGFIPDDFKYYTEYGTHFEQSFIGFHDLTTIMRHATVISVSGAATLTSNMFQLDNNGQLVATCGHYFTLQFQGYNIFPENPNNLKIVQSVDKNNIIGKEILTDFNDLNKIISYSPKERQRANSIMKRDFSTDRIIYSVIKPTMTNNKTTLKAISENPSQLSLPEMSFSSPCPPRWHQN